MAFTSTHARVAHPLVALATSLALLFGLVLTTVAPAQARPGDPAYGRLARGDGHLRGGCHNYYFHYRLKQAGNEWTFEVFWIDRTGRRVADQILLSESEPRRGRNHVRFCRVNTVPGRARLQGRLIIYSGSESETHWVRTAHFRMSA
jgi:hypothetical protein